MTEKEKNDRQKKKYNKMGRKLLKMGSEIGDHPSRALLLCFRMDLKRGDVPHGGGLQENGQ